MLEFLQVAPPPKWPFLYVEHDPQPLPSANTRGRDTDRARALLAALVLRGPNPGNRHGTSDCCGTAAQKTCSPLSIVYTSVEELAALLCTAVAGQLVAGILNRELVVVGELLSTVDTPRGKDDDVLLAVHCDDPRVAVGLTGVVDEAGSIAMHRGIYHLVVIDAKHVTANSLPIVVFLPFVSEHRPNDISRVFNDHLPCINGFLAEQTSAMNGRPVDSNSFLRGGLELFESHSQWQLHGGTPGSPKLPFVVIFFLRPVLRRLAVF